MGPIGRTGAGVAGPQGETGATGATGATGINSLTVEVDFGETFTDKVVVVVTGQTWVTATSEILAHLMTPAGVDPDELRLLDLKPIISARVVGVGFTLTVFSENEARGTYDFSVIGA